MVNVIGPQTIVSAKLPTPLYEFIDNYKWENRLTKTNIILEALNDWAKSKGYVPPPEDEESETGDAK